MNFYFYKVDFYSEVDASDKIETGITFGNSYPDAVRRLTDFYGESAINNLTIDLTPYENCIITNESILNDLREAEVW